MDLNKYEESLIRFCKKWIMPDQTYKMLCNPNIYVISCSVLESSPEVMRVEITKDGFPFVLMDFDNNTNRWLKTICF